MTSRWVIAAVAAAALAAGGAAAWAFWLAPTRIAVLNMQDFQVAEMLEANDNPFVRIVRLEQGDLDEVSLSKCRLLIIFGMGLTLSPEEQAIITEAAATGTRVYALGVTNDSTDIALLQEDERVAVGGYLGSGGPENLRRLFNYARRALDGKRLFSGPVEPPMEIPTDALFHTAVDTLFESVSAYQQWYEEAGLFEADRPKIAMITSIMGASGANQGYARDLVEGIQTRGWNVYAVSGFRKRLEFLKEIVPDLVVYVPHGRIAPGRSEETLAWLKERDVPVLTPIDVFQPYDEWLATQQGLTGGFLSQSIAMPELDGGIEPYAFAAQYRDENGLYVSRATPDRLQMLLARIGRWLALREKENAEKRIAIVYYKGPGLSAMVAGGMEVAPSLFHTLHALQDAGYETGPLPETVEALMEDIVSRGPVLGPYAEGAFDAFIESGDPELVATEDYLAWVEQALHPDLWAEVERRYGPAPGSYLRMTEGDASFIALPRVRYGNVVLLPQLLTGLGDDVGTLVHGAKMAPPHPYIAQYLWIRYGFKADAVMHFGTHGSFEFTPWKQTGLSGLDWPDALLGDLPHPYVYVINNIGEAIIAKRRSYATIVSHLTPPFTEAGAYGPMAALQEAMTGWSQTGDSAVLEERRDRIASLVAELGLHKDIGVESPDAASWTDEEMGKLHNYLHTTGQEKITRGLYALGEPYAPEEAAETARLMAVDPVAWSMARLDVARGAASAEETENPERFDTDYRQPAFVQIDAILAGEKTAEDFVAAEDLERVRRWDAAQSAGRGPGAPAPSADAVRAADVDMEALAEDKDVVDAIRTWYEALSSVRDYRDSLLASTEAELDGVLAALDGRHIPPSSGGDAIGNPRAVPTGRNLAAIDAEKCPTEAAWQTGVKLAEAVIAKKIAETGDYPRKMAVTLWGGEFIRSEGVEIAMILHMLGCEPVRNSRGSVHDVRLIPAEELGRPRIDVVVQTSGQFRDVGASRIFLINRAVELASEAPDAPGAPNRVREGTLAAEQVMKEKGLSPLEAQELATARVFGGVNGSFGTAIMGLVESGDRWESDEEIADQYLNNMGAIYAEGAWGRFAAGAFEAALQHTDTLVHPRSSNTWGPLSLDHVYEFMGGMSAVIRKVTGNDAEAMFADLRNKSAPKIQGAKEAIWMETRSTLMNPKYIQDLQRGGASSADTFAETFRNVYGWNATRPEIIDDEVWDNLYDVYIEDAYELGMEAYFREKNPYALQEMAAVMLETARKGLWEADAAQIARLAVLHAELVRDHRAGCTGFICDNAKLREMVAARLPEELEQTYNAAIDEVRVGAAAEEVEGLTLEREPDPIARAAEMLRENPALTGGLLLVAAALVALVVLGARRGRDDSHR